MNKTISIDVTALQLKKVQKNCNKGITTTLQQKG